MGKYEVKMTKVVKATIELTANSEEAAADEASRLADKIGSEVAWKESCTEVIANRRGL